MYYEEDDDPKNESYDDDEEESFNQRNPESNPRTPLARKDFLDEPGSEGEFEFDDTLVEAVPNKRRALDDDDDNVDDDSEDDGNFHSANEDEEMLELSSFSSDEVELVLPHRPALAERQPNELPRHALSEKDHKAARSSDASSVKDYSMEEESAVEEVLPYKPDLRRITMTAEMDKSASEDGDVAHGPERNGISAGVADGITFFEACETTATNFRTTQKPSMGNQGISNDTHLPFVTPFLHDNMSTTSSMGGARQLGGQFESMSVQVLNSPPSEIDISSDASETEELSHHRHRTGQVGVARLYGEDRLEGYEAAFSDLGTEESEGADGAPLLTKFVVDSYEQEIFEALNDTKHHVENTKDHVGSDSGPFTSEMIVNSHEKEMVELFDGNRESVKNCSKPFRDFQVFMHDGFFGVHDEDAVVELMEGDDEQIIGLFGGTDECGHGTVCGLLWSNWVLPVMVMCAVTAPAVHYLLQNWDEFEVHYEAPCEPEELTWTEWLWSWV